MKLRSLIPLGILKEDQRITLYKVNLTSTEQQQRYNSVTDSKGKPVNLPSGVIGGLNTSQGPDDGSTGAYFEKVDYQDGTPVPDQELDKINDKYYLIIIELAIEFWHNAVSDE